ncbi:MAG: PD40 domain-containing protein, partial [Chloroflexi bacterium]|nr:PD40 domain-containing protein [Chloroflexota bacterium]
IVVPEEAVFFEDHYYLVFDFQVSWEKAVAISESENGHLVTINNARENLFVSNLARERGLGVYWIGLTDEGTEGTFRWITGEPLIYQNWASGEPNNDADNEHFVETGTDGDGRWNDRRGGKLWPFVIEYDEFGGTPPTNVPSPTPTPTPLPELPNLVPAHLTQWDAPLVTSAVITSFLDVPPPLENRFTVGQEIYISWAITNDSRTAVSQPFMVGILVDGNLLMKFEVPRLDSRGVYRELNHLLVIDESGEHEVTMFIDINRVIAESDESDNTYATFPVWRSKADIVFVSDRDGNDEIYVMADDGADQTRLTFEPTFDGFPAWSPDATMIAFESSRDGNNEIYVMNADGSDQRNLTNHGDFDSAPTWSPDGSQITFVSSRDGGALEIYVMNADGSDQTRLTRNSAVDDFPSWSPSGSKIIFESDRDGDHNIYVMNPDGTKVERLTLKSSSDNHARVSPDGSKIAFVSDRSGNNEIYISTLRITELTRLTFADGNDSWPNWSPDSKEIVFYSDRDGVNNIFVFAADGSTRIALTGNKSSDTYPHWAPR